MDDLVICASLAILADYVGVPEGVTNFLHVDAREIVVLHTRNVELRDDKWVCLGVQVLRIGFSFELFHCKHDLVRVSNEKVIFDVIESTDLTVLTAILFNLSLLEQLQAGFSQ